MGGLQISKILPINSTWESTPKRIIIQPACLKRTNNFRINNQLNNIITIRIDTLQVETTTMLMVLASNNLFSSLNNKLIKLLITPNFTPHIHNNCYRFLTVILLISTNKLNSMKLIAESYSMHLKSLFLIFNLKHSADKNKMNSVMHQEVKS